MLDVLGNALLNDIVPYGQPPVGIVLVACSLQDLRDIVPRVRPKMYLEKLLDVKITKVTIQMHVITLGKTSLEMLDKLKRHDVLNIVPRFVLCQ